LRYSKWEGCIKQNGGHLLFGGSLQEIYLSILQPLLSGALLTSSESGLQPIPAKPTFAQLLAEYDLTPQDIAMQSGLGESAVLVFVTRNQWFTTEIEQMIVALNAYAGTQLTIDDLSIEYAHPRHLCKPTGHLYPVN